MDVTLTAVLAVLASYVLGSLPAAAWLARARGIDIRTVGSGNSGATNMMRAAGKGPAVAVATFDVFKGVLVIWLARWLGLGENVAALCGIAAVIGHNFSPFLGFRGGKGAATTFGVMVSLVPVVGIGTAVIFLTTVWLTRLVSAGSILGVIAGTLVAVVTGQTGWLCLAVALLSALLIYQHRENIGRLTSGKERRLGDKS
ncbi:MAG: hypothetical protein JWQ08_242 [Deinococcus sp.]|nr:hypothetical protein [Deinococcus sp.]